VEPAGARGIRPERRRLPTPEVFEDGKALLEGTGALGLEAAQQRRRVRVTI
jgi:hypothetical protein